MAAMVHRLPLLVAGVMAALVVLLGASVMAALVVLLGATTDLSA